MLILLNVNFKNTLVKNLEILKKLLKFSEFSA